MCACASCARAPWASRVGLRRREYGRDTLHGGAGVAAFDPVAMHACRVSRCHTVCTCAVRWRCVRLLYGYLSLCGARCVSVCGRDCAARARDVRRNVTSEKKTGVNSHNCEGASGPRRPPISHKVLYAAARTRYCDTDNAVEMCLVWRMSTKCGASVGEHAFLCSFYAGKYGNRGVITHLHDIRHSYRRQRAPP